MKRLLLACATTLWLAPLAACGTESEHAGDPADVRTSTAAEIPHATGPHDVVMQVVTGGGYTAYEYAVSIRPSITVYGDGTVIVEPDGAEDGDVHRMVTLQEAHVDEATIQTVLRMARDAGLLAVAPDYAMGGPMVTDNPTTTLTLRTSDGRFEHAAYALGLTDGGSSDTADRKNLRDFIAEATEAVVHGARLSPYVPRQIGLYVSDDGARRAGSVPWPGDLGIDLAAKGAQACHDVTSEQARSLTDLLGGTGLDHDLRQGGTAYSVVGVQVLPGERCPVGR